MRFRQWCDAAGLKHCSSHGLRKAGATIAAENGATEQQLMAIFGWADSRQPSNYTRKANRRKMAAQAMPLLVPGRGETETEVSHFPAEIQTGGTLSPKKARNQLLRFDMEATPGIEPGCKDLQSSA